MDDNHANSGGLKTKSSKHSHTQIHLDSWLVYKTCII